MNHLFDNSVVGMALLAVLVFFVACLAITMLSCFRPMAVASAGNFNQVATVVAGLVLTVASGALGVSPAVGTGVQPGSSSAGSQASVANNVGATPTVTLASAQVGAFKSLYTTTYIVTGLLCLVVFMIPTRQTHELVRNVGLTTLAFLGLLVSSNLNGGASDLNVKLDTPPVFAQASGE